MCVCACVHIHAKYFDIIFTVTGKYIKDWLFYRLGLQFSAEWSFLNRKAAKEIIKHSQIKM